MKMPKSLAVLMLACVVALPLAPAAARQDVPQGLKLLADGDALADKGKYDEAVLTYMKGFEQLLPGVRGLEFKRPVQGKLMPREELTQYLLKTFDEEIPPEELRGGELTLKALGLVEEDFDLKATMIAMLTEEIAAFYDAETESMHLIHEALPPGPPKKPGLFGRLLGVKPAFDKEETKGVLAHEMAHALADQHYDLDAMSESAKGDSDRELALAALVEGEAMLAMIAAVGEDWEGTGTAETPASVFELSLAMMAPMMTSSGGKAFRNAPPILTETLTFPYLRGLVFCSSVANEGGWAGLSAAYANPPLSTEQVLHPEKYVRGEDGEPGPKYDAPQRLDVGELSPGEAWKEVDRDVMGELTISILLRKHRGAAAAAGWDGDTCVVFEGPEGKLAVAWMSTWDTARDAREFAENYAKYQGARFGLDGAGDDDEEGATNPAEEAAEKDLFGDDGDEPLRRQAGDKLLHIELRGNEVVIIEGFDEATTDAMAKAALAARKQEIRPQETDR